MSPRASLHSNQLESTFLQHMSSVLRLLLCSKCPLNHHLTYVTHKVSSVCCNSALLVDIAATSNCIRAAKLSCTREYVLSCTRAAQELKRTSLKYASNPSKGQTCVHLHVLRPPYRIICSVLSISLITFKVLNSSCVERQMKRFI